MDADHAADRHRDIIDFVERCVVILVVIANRRIGASGGVALCSLTIAERRSAPMVRREFGGERTGRGEPGKAVCAIVRGREAVAARGFAQRGRVRIVLRATSDARVRARSVRLAARMHVPTRGGVRIARARRATGRVRRRPPAVLRRGPGLARWMLTIARPPAAERLSRCL
jgi:hypothetical protein